jgi:septation ring formation regulator EzrA
VTVTPGEAWTDERLDDLNTRIEKRFDEVDRRFDQVDRRFEQVDRRFEQVDRRFEKVEAEIRELRTEMKEGFESLQRTMILGFITMTASIVAAVPAAIIAT